MTQPRTKAIPGYHIQPILPITFCLDGTVEDRIGLIKSPYTLVLTLKQAREADIIERD